MLAFILLLLTLSKGFPPFAPACNTSGASPISSKRIAQLLHGSDGPVEIVSRNSLVYKMRVCQQKPTSCTEWKTFSAAEEWPFVWAGWFPYNTKCSAPPRIMLELNNVSAPVLFNGLLPCRVNGQGLGTDRFSFPALAADDGSCQECTTLAVGPSPVNSLGLWLGGTVSDTCLSVSTGEIPVSNGTHYIDSYFFLVGDIDLPLDAPFDSSLAAKIQSAIN